MPLLFHCLYTICVVSRNTAKPVPLLLPFLYTGNSQRACVRNRHGVIFSLFATSLNAFSWQTALTISLV